MSKIVDASMIRSIFVRSPKLGLYVAETMGIKLKDDTIKILKSASKNDIPDDVTELFIVVDKFKRHMSNREKAKLLAEALLLSAQTYVYFARVLHVPITRDIMYNESKYYQYNFTRLFDAFNSVSEMLNKYRKP